MSQLDQTRKKPRRFLGMNFDPTISFVDIIVIGSVLLGGVGLYSNNEARAQTQQVAIDGLNKANLPNRMTAVEVQTADLKDGLGLIHQDLQEIRKSLDDKQDKRN